MNTTKKAMVPMKGFISTALRHWFENENGTYEEFKKKYAFTRWVKTDLTIEMFNYIKTNPPKVYKSAMLKENDAARAKKAYWRKKGVTTEEKEAEAPVKRKYNRTAPYTPPVRQRLYKAVWTVEKGEIGEEGFKALELFIERLISLKKANFEIVQYIGGIVEVREFN